MLDHSDALAVKQAAQANRKRRLTRFTHADAGDRRADMERLIDASHWMGCGRL